MSGFLLYGGCGMGHWFSPAVLELRVNKPNVGLVIIYSVLLLLYFGLHH